MYNVQYIILSPLDC